MRLFKWLTDFFAGSSNFPRSPLDEGISINPATGLPMNGPGIGGVDAGGSPFGQDLDRWEDHQAHHDPDHHTSGITGSGFDHWPDTAAEGFDPSRGY